MTKFNPNEDEISVSKDPISGQWRWTIVFVGQEDCHYNDDMFDTPGQAADAAWAFIQKQA